MIRVCVGVQRGDAEMSQKLWRVVRCCVERGEDNPIQQIHDQGAGGNCNVVKEIIYPLGAEIDVRQVAPLPFPPLLPDASRSQLACLHTIVACCTKSSQI